MMNARPAYNSGAARSAPVKRPVKRTAALQHHTTATTSRATVASSSTPSFFSINAAEHSAEAEACEVSADHDQAEHRRRAQQDVRIRDDEAEPAQGIPGGDRVDHGPPCRRSERSQESARKTGQGGSAEHRDGQCAPVCAFHDAVAAEYHGRRGDDELERKEPGADQRQAHGQASGACHEKWARRARGRQRRKRYGYDTRDGLGVRDARLPTLQSSSNVTSRLRSAKRMPRGDRNQAACVTMHRRPDHAIPRAFG